MKCNTSNTTIRFLRDIADIQTGPFGSQLHKEDYVEYGTPIVTVEHLGNRKFTEQNLPKVSDSDKERLKKYVLATGDIVFSRVGSVDRCSYVDEEHNGWMFSGRCLRVRPSENIDSLYLYYYFCREETRQFVRNIAVGATMPSINTKLLGEVPVAVPDLQIQKMVSNILSTIDDKIELNIKINANLQQQAQAIFKSWFVDFEPFGGTRPEDWNFICLEDCCSLITRGIAPKYDDTTDQIVLNQKCIRNQQIDLSKARKHRPKKVNEKWLQHGDILINSTGQGTLGRIAQVHFQPQNMTVDSHVTIVRPKHELLVYYLGCLLTGREYEFVEMERGSTGQTELPRESVQKYEVLLPDDAILKRFNDLMRPIFQLLVQNQEESLRLAELRDALLPKLMSGELNLFNI